MATYYIENRFFAHLISNNPDYDKYNVAHTCMYLTIQKCIELKGKEFHMLWGTGFYKGRFLAVANQLHSTTIMRSSITKYIYVFKYDILPRYRYTTLKRNIKRYLKNLLLKVS